MSGRRTYMRSYYEKNKERLLSRRAQRYQNDPEFKARLCAQRRDSMRRARLLGNNSENRATAPRQSTGVLMQLPVQGHTFEVPMYGYTEVSSKAAIQRARLSGWSKKDWFPAPTWRNTRNFNLYTEYEMQGIVSIIATHRSKLAANGYSFRATAEFKQDMAALKASMIQGIPLSVIQEAKANAL